MSTSVLLVLAGVVAGAGLTLGAGVWAVRRQVERVRAAERRARTHERLAELGALTAGLAHEIKNPLSTIGLNAQLLAEAIDDLALPGDEQARLKRRVGTLAREVERLGGILSDFLEYAGEARLETSPTDLNGVVEELIDFFHPQAERQGVRLRHDLEAGPLTAMLDARHVKQAVLNLMLNATQAMTAQANQTEGGASRELILKTARGVDEERRPMVVLHVIDTGPGMDGETVDQVFKPYFTTKAGGSGLGLPTARRLIEQHGGRIDVHTEPGRGTDFVVQFPATEAEPQPAAGRPGPGGAEQSAAR